MTSCTYSTQTVTSNMWPAQVECDVFANHSPYQNNGRNEINDDQILDFERLESDIMKNVLCEDSGEDDEKFAGAVFPSFNYAPVPTPTTLSRLKPAKPLSNGLLIIDSNRVEPVDIIPSSRQRSTCTSNLNGASVIGLKTNERRKLNHKKSYSKIFDSFCSSRDRHGGNAKQSGKKQSKYQALKNNSQLSAAARPTKPPAVITIARRQWNHNINNRPQSPSFLPNASIKSNPFAFLEQEKESIKLPKNFSKNLSPSSTNSLTLSTVFDSPPKSDKEVSVTLGRPGTQRRNLTLRQSNRTDQKKRKIGEKTAKTFAQIVAASPAVAPKSNHRFYKF